METISVEVWLYGPLARYGGDAARKAVVGPRSGTGTCCHHPLASFSPVHRDLRKEPRRTDTSGFPGWTGGAGVQPRRAAGRKLFLVPCGTAEEASPANGIGLPAPRPGLRQPGLL